MEWETPQSEAEGLLTQEEFADVWADVEQLAVKKRRGSKARARSPKRSRRISPPARIDYGYLSAIPLELQREALLRLPPIEAQRLCMQPEFSRRCTGDFWNEKAGIPRVVKPREEPPMTLDDYGSDLIEQGTCAYGTIKIAGKNKWCLLDALAKRDLDRFRYYLDHTRINSQADYGRDLQWFAWFAGPEFSQLVPPDLDNRLKIAALEGDVDTFVSILQYHPNLLDYYTHSYVNPAVAGGSLPIVRYLFEDPGPIGARVRSYYSGDTIFRLLNQARHNKHPDIEEYIWSMIPRGKPSPDKRPQLINYLTEPMFRKGKYEWRTSYEV